MTRAPSPTRLVVALVCLSGANGAAHALDVRALSLGGSVVADGEGVPGAISNPAALMAMQRRGETTHLSIGFGAETRDPGGLLEAAREDDNQGLLDDLEREIDAIDLREVSCVPEDRGSFPANDDPCLDGLGALSELSGRALSIADPADGEVTAVQGGADTGVAFTGHAYPFALHLRTRATGRGRIDVTDDDRAYLRRIEDTLADGVLSYGEILESAEFSLDTDARRIGVLQPEEVLESRGEGGYVVRVTFAASVATSVELGGRTIDIGVTPKLSNYTAGGVGTSVADELDDETASIADRLEDNEESGSSFTFDIGASTALASLPIRLAAVVRNVVPESIETPTGLEFETTAQLIVGGAIERGPLTFNADLALNEADIDGLPTQVIALGAQFERGPLALRAGLNQETARASEATALSLGLGLGPLELGMRAAGIEETYGGVQLSFTF